MSPWRLFPSADLLSLALETGLTAYDASYLWVAKSLGCELLTFDEQLARAARTAQAVAALGPYLRRNLLIVGLAA